MNGHGTEKNTNPTYGTCPYVGNPAETTSCIILDIVMNTGKNYRFYLFDDETMNSQAITNYLAKNSTLFKVLRQPFLLEKVTIQDT